MNGSLVPVQAPSKVIYHCHMINCLSRNFFLDCYDAVHVQARRPTKLDLQIDRGSDFATWKVQWDSYLSLSGLDNEDAAKQVQALTCYSYRLELIV